jgi:hypothetical protein
MLGLSGVKNNFVYAKNIIKSSLSRSDNYITETFDEALERIGVDEDDVEKHLDKVYSKIRNEYFLFLLIFALAFLYLIIEFVSFSSLAKLSMPIFMLIIFVMIVEKTFRCYQIRKKELVSFRDFFFSKNSFLVTWRRNG